MRGCDKNKHPNPDLRLAQTIHPNHSIPTEDTTAATTTTTNTTNKQPRARFGAGELRERLPGAQGGKHTGGAGHGRAAGTQPGGRVTRATRQHTRAQHVPLALPVLAPGPGDDTTAR